MSCLARGDSANCAGQTDAVEKVSAVVCGSSIMNNGQFWMFAIYDKDELENLTADQEKALKKAIDAELKARGTQ